MKYLVDANVLSEPTKPSPRPAVVEWLGENQPELAVDPIVLGEIRFGILLLPTSRRRSMLESWFEDVVKGVRCLSWEADTAIRWAELLARLRAKGVSIPIKDSLIAATALVHGLRIVTRNRADFQKAGLEVVDPFVA